MAAKNPAYNDLVRFPKDDSGEVVCPECYAALVHPDHCSICHGANAMTTFCPNCEMNCGCEQYG